MALLTFAVEVKWSQICNSLSHLQLCVSRKIRVYRVCFASNYHAKTKVWLPRKHMNKITQTRCLLPLQNYIFFDQRNIHAHIYWRDKAVPSVCFFLSFTTVCKCGIYPLCLASKYYADTKFVFRANMTKVKQTWCLLSLQTYLSMRQMYFHAYIYWRGKVAANLYFPLPFTTVCNSWANAVFNAFA